MPRDREDEEVVSPRALTSDAPLVGGREEVVAQRLLNPDFLERVGGPPPEKREGGLAETIGQFTTSNLGRGLLGALAVGLSGLRNPSDQGRFQEQVLAGVTSDIERRRAAQEQEDSISGLMGVVNEANRLINAGDLEGASRAVAQASRLPALKRNPQAINIILKLQQDLTQRASTRQAIKSVREGATTEIPATPGVQGEDVGGIGPFQIAPGTPARRVTRPLTQDDLLSLAERTGSLGVAKDLSSFLPKPEAPFRHYDPETQSLIVLRGNQVQTFQVGTPGLPKRLKLSDVTGKTRTALEGVLGRAGVPINQWVADYNRQDPQALGYWQQATEQAGEADLKSEAERSADKELKADIAAGRVAKPKDDVAYGGLLAERIQQRAVGVAGAKAGAAEVSRSAAELQQPPTQYFGTTGGGIIALDGYKDVTRSYRTMADALKDQEAGKVTVIRNGDQYKQVVGTRNTLNNFKNIREIGNRIFARDDYVGVLKQGGLAALASYVGTGPLAEDVRQLQGMTATAFDTARALGGDSRISDADARFALQAMGSQTWFSSKAAFNATLDRMEGVFKQGLKRAARDERAESTQGEGEWIEVAPGIRMRRKK